MLRGKKILLGITGSIAAYKSSFLVRLLVREGAEVKVVLTPAARDFVTPLTLSTLSRNPVLWQYFDPEDEEGKWNNHVDLALWADLILIAPATAHSLSKMVHGTADNFLLGIYLSAKCPVYFAPAMDRDMYQHPSTRQNIEKLQSYGHRHIPSGTGELASGLEGEGRMAEPEDILAFIKEDLAKDLPLRGFRVLVNGGPTYEPLDPVRFLGNHSSGKTGIALAEQAARLGAEVHLVLGPTHLKPAEEAVHVHRVQTAREMLAACEKHFPRADIAIFSAAISDYRPAQTASQKIKKSGEEMQITLAPNPDILAKLGATKSAKQVVVGFALETENELANARQKLHKKNCDLIVVNTPGEASGFGHDTNRVILLDRHQNEKHLELKQKSEIAREIFLYLVDHFGLQPAG